MVLVSCGRNSQGRSAITRLTVSWVGNWKMLIEVPRNDDEAVVELGLWSMSIQSSNRKQSFLQIWGANAVVFLEPFAD